MIEKTLGQMLYEAEVEVRGLRNRWAQLEPGARDQWERVALKFTSLLNGGPEMEVVAVLRPVVR